MRPSRFSALAAAMMLSGCNLAPPYRPPPVQPPAAYKEAGAWRPAAPADASPRGDWWTLFGDPTLDGFEQRLEAGNPNLAAAVARYDQAKAFADLARAGLYPQVVLDGGLSRNRQSDNRPLRGAATPNEYGSNQVDAQAGYELDLWGRVRNQVRMGAAQAQASQADEANVRLSLHAELASDYVSLRGLDHDAKLLADTVAAYQRARDMTRTLFLGKLVSSLDVSRAETQLQTAKAQAADIASRRAAFEHAIAVLVGVPAANLSIDASISPLTLPDIPTGVPASLLQRRPDIASAERNAYAANAGIGVARAAFYPSVTLSALGGTQSTGLNLMNLGDSFWSLGPNVTLPLVNGGALRAQQAAAYAKFDEASANYRATVLNAFREVEDDLAQLRWLGQEQANEEAAAQAAQNSLNVATELYRQGASSYLEVVTAQTPLLQAQQAVLDLQTRRLLADVSLVRALGGGWRQDEESPPLRGQRQTR